MTETAAQMAGNPRVHRPAASATWSKDHHWGSQITDVRTYSVTRTASGGIHVVVGGKDVDIPLVLIPWFVDAISQAGLWSEQEQSA